MTDWGPIAAVLVYEIRSGFGDSDASQGGWSARRRALRGGCAWLCPPVIAACLREGQGASPTRSQSAIGIFDRPSQPISPAAALSTGKTWDHLPTTGTVSTSSCRFPLVPLRGRDQRTNYNHRRKGRLMPRVEQLTSRAVARAPPRHAPARPSHGSTAPSPRSGRVPLLIEPDKVVAVLSELCRNGEPKGSRLDQRRCVRVESGIRSQAGEIGDPSTIMNILYVQVERIILIVDARSEIDHFV